MNYITRMIAGMLLVAACIVIPCSTPTISQTTYAVLCPGITNFGGDSFEKNLIINTQFSRYNTLDKKTGKVDLGQTNVVNHFIEQFKQDPDVQHTFAKQEKILVLGVSQGTAGAVGLVTEMAFAQQEQKIGGIVLEAVLGSAHSAALHQASYNRGPAIHGLTYVPFLARSRMPLWIGKYTQFPTLKVFGGRDLLSTIKNISPNIPLIILGDVNDHQVSINDGRQAYINARNNGNLHAYLIETDSGEKRHIDLLGDGPTLGGQGPNNGPNRATDIQCIAALQAIYKKEGLPFEATFEKTDLTQLIEETDLSDYQPSVTAVERKIYWSNCASRWTRNAIDLLMVVAVSTVAFM